MHVWVAIDAAAAVGFVAVRLHAEDRLGEVYMLAVDPALQGRGIGSADDPRSQVDERGRDGGSDGRDPR